MWSFVPYIVVRSHHSDVPLHTRQAQKQGLHDEHQWVHVTQKGQESSILPQEEVGKAQGQVHVEQDLYEGQMEGKEVCRQDHRPWNEIQWLELWQPNHNIAARM